MSFKRKKIKLRSLGETEKGKVGNHEQSDGEFSESLFLVTFSSSNVLTQQIYLYNKISL